MELTYSEIMTFKRCPYRWDKQYNQQLSPKIKPVALLYGSYVHELLDEFYKCQERSIFSPDGVKRAVIERSEDYYKSKTEEMFIEEAEALYGEIKKTAEEQVCRYVDHYIDDLKKYKVIGVEEQFRVNILNPDSDVPFLIPTDAYLNGKFDLILQDEYENVLLGEHKTTSLNIETRLADLELDEQCSYYTWALKYSLRDEGLQIPVSGVIYNVLRKKSPTIPRLLKKGGLTKDKSCDTTYDVYLQAIIENELNPDDYDDMLTMLKLKGNTFFGREIATRSQLEIDNTGIDLYNIYKHISRTKTLFRNRCYNCGRDCSYKDLCIAELKGYDTEQIIKEKYEKREVRHPELNEEEE